MNPTFVTCGEDGLRPLQEGDILTCPGCGTYNDIRYWNTQQRYTRLRRFNSIFTAIIANNMDTPMGDAKNLAWIILSAQNAEAQRIFELSLTQDDSSIVQQIESSVALTNPPTDT